MLFYALLVTAGSHHHHTGNAHDFGIDDSVLGHQPINNHYEVKRENSGTVGNENPFLSRRPKSIKVNLKRFDRSNQKRGQPGWVPIPYPVYKK